MVTLIGSRSVFFFCFSKREWGVSVVGRSNGKAINDAVSSRYLHQHTDISSPEIQPRKKKKNSNVLSQMRKPTDKNQPFCLWLSLNVVYPKHFHFLLKRGKVQELYSCLALRCSTDRTVWDQLLLLKASTAGHISTCVYVCVQYVCVCMYAYVHFARGVNPLAIKYSSLLQYLSLFVGFCRRCEPIVNTEN